MYYYYYSILVYSTLHSRKLATLFVEEGQLPSQIPYPVPSTGDVLYTTLAESTYVHSLRPEVWDSVRMRMHGEILGRSTRRSMPRRMGCCCLCRVPANRNGEPAMILPVPSKTVEMSGVGRGKWPARNIMKTVPRNVL